MAKKLDLYEFKMALFDNGNPEEFLLFIGNFQMNLEASRTLTSGAKIQYIYMLVHGEVLRQFDTLSIEVGSTTVYHLTPFFNFRCVLFSGNALSKQKRVMRRSMRKTQN